MRRREWLWIAIAAGLAFVAAKRSRAQAAPAPAVTTPETQAGTAQSFINTITNALPGGSFNL